MSEQTSERRSTSLQLSSIFLIVLPFFLSFAMVGTLVRSGGGFSGGGCATYEVYEHGWPFPFGERLESRGSNRYAVWSGDRTYSWKLILADGASAAGMAAAVALLVRAFAARKWLVSALAIIFVGTLVALLSFQIHSTLVQSEIEQAIGMQQEKYDYYVERKYLGPLWLVRLTGGNDRWRKEMDGIEYIRIEDPKAVDHPEKISYLAQDLNKLRDLKKVELWGEMTIPYGPDFELQRREIMAAIEEQQDRDSSLPQPEDSWIPVR